MKIGVVSDTHGFLDPQLAEHLRGVDAIVHAGDVGSEDMLAELKGLAKVYAVAGNVDSPLMQMPLTLKWRLGNLQLEVLHELAAPQSELRLWSGDLLLQKLNPERREAFLKSFDPATRLIVFGHTHQPSLDLIGTRLFLNPGSAGKKRFSLPRSYAMIETFPRGVRASIESLEGYNERLPRNVWLPVEE